MRWAACLVLAVLAAAQSAAGAARATHGEAGIAGAAPSATASSASASASASAPDCDSKAYQKTVLFPVTPGVPLAAFLDESASPRLDVFEASGIALAPPVGPGAPPPPLGVVVMDNSPRLAALTALVPAPAGVLLPPPESGGGGGGGSDPPLPPPDPARPGVSEWEGVSFGPDAATVLALVEAAAVPGAAPGAPRRRARVDELRLPAGLGGRGGGNASSSLPSSPSFSASAAPTVVRSCLVAWDLADDNKGLEDLVYLGGGRALFLCEGNGCAGGREGRDTDAGGVVLLATLDFSPAAADEPGGCVWRVDRTIHLPASAAFTDYAGLAVRDGVVAVLSQEDAAVWVGRLDAGSGQITDLPVSARGGDNGKKASTPSVRPSWPGPVFRLPRDGGCRRSLCTAEGLAWLDPPSTPGARLAIVTDRAKPGVFPWSCVAGAQAVHVLALPRGGEVVGGGGG
jgi:hypothetical protein